MIYKNFIGKINLYKKTKKFKPNMANNENILKIKVSFIDQDTFICELDRKTTLQSLFQIISSSCKINSFFNLSTEKCLIHLKPSFEPIETLLNLSENPLEINLCCWTSKSINITADIKSSGDFQIEVESLDGVSIFLSIDKNELFETFSQRFSHKDGKCSFALIHKISSPITLDNIPVSVILPENQRKLILLKNVLTFEPIRFWQCSEIWESKPCTKIGISQLICCLYVMKRWSTDDFFKFISYCSKWIYFPSVFMVLYKIHKNMTMDCYFEASLIANYFHSLFRKILSSEISDDKIFENTRECLMFFIHLSEKESIKNMEYWIDSKYLICSKTYKRCINPCFKKNDNNGLLYEFESLEFNEKTEISLFFKSICNFNNIDDVIFKKDFNISKLTNEEISEILKENDIKIIYNSFNIGKQKYALNIIPILNLASSKFPCLITLRDKNIIVAVGFEACSIGKITSLDPILGLESSINIQEYADQMSNEYDVREELLDTREPKEAIMVLLDVSLSMSSKSFIDGQIKNIFDNIIPDPSEEEEEELWKSIKDDPALYYIAYSNELWMNTQAYKKMLIDLHKSFSKYKNNSKFIAKIMDKIAKHGKTLSEPNWKYDCDFGSWKITWKLTNGETGFFFIDEHQTVISMREKIADILNVDVKKIECYINGKEIKVKKAHTIIDDYEGLYNECTILVVPKNPNDKLKAPINQKKDYIKITFKQNSVAFETVYAKKDTPIHLLKIYLHYRYVKDQFIFVSNVKESGDGYFTGSRINIKNNIEHAWIYYGKSSQFDMEKSIDITLFEGTDYENDEKDELNRLQVVQQLFHSFIHRCQAYNYPTKIGLILFGSEVKETCPITSLFEKFKRKVDEAMCNGDTKLYDSMEKGIYSLNTFCEKFPNCKKRILCFTDGEDVGSTASVMNIVKLLSKHSIILDAISINSNVDKEKNLHSIAKSSGGYSFHPNNLIDALKCMELETIVYCGDRESSYSIKPITYFVFDIMKSLPFDSCERDKLPKRKLPSQLESSTMDAIKWLESSTKTNGNNHLMFSKISKEISQILKNTHPDYQVFPCEEDITFWKIDMFGPKDSLYSGGNWKLYAKFPEDYPSSAPEVRFISPILHVNVNSYGKVCHSILGRNWTSDTPFSKVLDCIYGLLLHPEVSDPIDTNLATLYFQDKTTYEEKVRKSIIVELFNKKN